MENQIKMTKNEILEFCILNNVKSTNLKSSMKLKADLRKAVDNKTFDTVQKWLKHIEDKQEEKAVKKSHQKTALKFNLALVEYLKLKEKAESILLDFDTDHSMGCYKRLFLNKKLFAQNHNLSSYSKSCSYKPTYGEVSIDLSKKELREIVKIEGVWTISNNGGNAKWLTSKGQKNNFQVIVKKGFLYKESHSEISLRDAIEIQHKKEIGLTKQILEDSRFVGIQHIYANGACYEGIINFVTKYGLNKAFGYSVGFLKSLDKSLVQRYLKA